jgi:hypothetical protein
VCTLQTVLTGIQHLKATADRIQYGMTALVLMRYTNWSDK